MIEVDQRPVRDRQFAERKRRIADIDEAASVVRMNPEVTEPNPRNFALYDERFAQFQQLYRDNRALFSRMDAQG